jgi:hypothetical protein
MNGAASSVPPDRRKLLGFTDNRQDAALQAGHFNDFLFVSLLRAATLAAVRKEGAGGLAEEDFGRRVQQALGFTAGYEGDWRSPPTRWSRPRSTRLLMLPGKGFVSLGRSLHRNTRDLPQP